jgi:alkylation response protein AidB-like acyl-CoA dehydrogenase
MGHVFRTEQQQLAVDGLKKFLAAEVEPVFQKEYRDIFVPRERLVEVTQRLVSFGLVAGVVSEAHGGMGVDWLTNLMLFEEIAACSADLSIPILINSFGAHVLENLAPAHLRERYLPGLLAGDSFCSFGISEPGVGSNVLEIKTRARRDGGDYILNGEKTWISNGSYSDFLVCTCRTGDDPRRGLTNFLLDRKDHPYVVANIQKIALNSQSTAQIFLDDVRVPASNMIGNEGEAFKNTLSGFERSRVFVAGQSLGIGRRALEEAVRYATERRQFGKVLAGHQLIAGMLAEMATAVDAARLLVCSSARLSRGIDDRRPSECRDGSRHGQIFCGRDGGQGLTPGRSDPRCQWCHERVPSGEARA